MTQEPTVRNARLNELEVPTGDVTIAGDDAAVAPGTSTSSSPGFGSWTQASADRPAVVTVAVTAQTDGTSDAIVNFQVDEDGGTTEDYSLGIITVANEMTAGADLTATATFVVPAGAQYQILNASDPNGANSLNTVREFTL
jgi:hypothetical protein